jgi:hypothetical protein
MRAALLALALILAGAGAAEAHDYLTPRGPVPVPASHVFSYDGRDLGPATCYVHPRHPALTMCEITQEPTP